MKFIVCPRITRVIVSALLLGAFMGLYVIAQDRRPSKASGLVTLENEHQKVTVAPGSGGAVVRWTHKATGVELLRGYQNRPLKGGSLGIWQECIMEEGLPAEPESPVAEIYQITDQSATALTLKAMLANGLALTRQMRLYTDRAGLDVVVSIQNPTDIPLVAQVRIRPEFWNQNHHEPAIWVERSGKWQRLVTEKYCGNLSNGTLSPTGIRRWALDIPGSKLALVNTFRAEELDSLYYWCRRPTQQADLQLILKQTPVASGEMRTVHASYELNNGLPTTSQFARTTSDRQSQ